MNTGAYGQLIVTLDGDAKLAQSHTEGIYTVASMPKNGKQYWIQDQGSNAIWYEKEKKDWLIGRKEDLGTDICSLYSRNDTTGPEEATTWKYLENGRWMSTSNIVRSLGMYY